MIATAHASRLLLLFLLILYFRLAHWTHQNRNVAFYMQPLPQFYPQYRFYQWPGIAQSVQRLATGWTVRGSNPGWGDIFRTCPDRPWGPPSLLYNGYRVFPGSKERPGRDADPSPPSSAVGHERVELYLYSPYGPYGLYRASVPVQGRTLPLPYRFYHTTFYCFT